MTQNQANYFEINLIQTMLNQCPLSSFLRGSAVAEKDSENVYFNEANKLKQIEEVAVN